MTTPRQKQKVHAIMIRSSTWLYNCKFCEFSSINKSELWLHFNQEHDDMEYVK